MRYFRGVVYICVIIMVLATVAFADIDYHGNLVSAPGDGSGIWVSDPGGDPEPPWFPAEIEWWVGQNVDGSIHYAYTLRVYAGEVSHFILETSEPLGEEDIFNESGKFGAVEMGKWFYPGPGNPDMPGPLYGVKFDDAWGTTFTVEFDSWRLPVWGDFYSKDGQAGGEGLNQFWNSGFLAADPTAPPADGSLDGHILRPDAYVPEPGTLTLMGLGLLGLAARVRRRNQSIRTDRSENS